MKDMQQGTARKLGGIAMTRRSIATVLGSLLVGLLLIVNATAISAADINGGGSAPLTVSSDTPCILDNAGNCAAREALISVASTSPAVAVRGIDDDVTVVDTTTLPGPVTANVAPFTVTDIQYGSDAMTPIVYCMQSAAGATTCYARDPNGMWVQQ
jgi:hypothetical protein